MIQEKYDKTSGAILFKKDKDSITIESLSKEVEELKSEIKTLKKMVKKLEASSK